MPQTGATWQADLRHRFLDRLVLKATGVSVFIWIFFQGYFHTLRHPAYPVTTMPLTALDRAIPFEPLSIVVYVSLWIYVGIAPGLMLRLRDLLLYGAWAAALCGGGLLIFHFWPTQVPPRPPELAALPGFGLLAGIDGAGNACPSLHVATAVFTAAWIARLCRWMRAPGWLHGVNGLWLLGIAWSTIASRQHVALDVLAGAAWGAAFAALSLWMAPRMGARIGPVPAASGRYHPVTIDRRSTVYPAPRPEDSP
jgi:membrane-associated phospholipid phosphatase